MNNVQIFNDMPFPEYLKIDAVNASSLWWLEDESPRYYKWRKAQPDKTTDAMTLGRAIHTATLEPDLLDAGYAVWDGGRRGTNAHKAFVADSAGRDIITADQRATALAVSASVNSSPEAMEKLGQGGTVETVIVWTHERTGLRCKIRVDFFGVDSDVDLKSSADIRPNKFESVAARLGYHFKAAFYGAGTLAATGDVRPFSLVTVESAAPHDVIVYEIPHEVMAIGELQVEAALDRLKECRDTNTWPGKSGGETFALHLPSWALPSEDEPITMGGVAVDF